MKKNNEKRTGFFKEMLGELSASMLFEVAWRILMYIPRKLIQLIKDIW
ncbi:MAG: hypothetical protein ABS944_05785 [Solibacillus sp.]|jgi:hypothetical protein